MIRVLVFGNILVEEDSLPLRLIHKLREEFSNFEFVEFDPAENLESEGPDLIIIDAVEGIEKVMVFTDVDSFQKTKRFSLHDFDLGMTLKLMQKLGKLNSVKIFGIPMNYDEQAAFVELKTFLLNEV